MTWVNHRWPNRTNPSAALFLIQIRWQILWGEGNVPIWGSCVLQDWFVVLRIHEWTLSSPHDCQGPEFLGSALGTLSRAVLCKCCFLLEENSIHINEWFRKYLTFWLFRIYSKWNVSKITQGCCFLTLSPILLSVPFYKLLRTQIN